MKDSGPPRDNQQERVARAAGTELLRSALDALDDGIVVVDLQTRVRLWNRRFAEMWRLSPEAIEGADAGHLLLLLADQLKDPEAALRRVRALTEDFATESVALLEFKDGRFFERASRPHQVGGETFGVLLVFRDVTAAQHSQEQLLRQLDMERTLIGTEGNLGVGYGVIESERFVHADAGCTRITGYDAQELLGVSIFELAAPEEQERLRTRTTRYRDGARAEERFETEILRKDGRRVPIDVVFRPFSLGRAAQVAVVIRDVTERKRSERAQASLQEQFRQAQKMEAVGRLAGGIAHDFNNLLGVIIGYAELMLRALAADDPLRRRLSEIVKAGKRAATLTSQLLAFSRKQVMQSTVLDLNALVGNLRPMLQQVTGEEVKLFVQLAPDLGSVKADPGQIEQVLMNLALNARDAMPRGGSMIVETANVELPPTEVRGESALAAGAYVMLAVSDTGSGMDAETQSHLFEPFFTTKEFGKGTGLGLATAYGIVRQSGGTTWVYSEPGRGSTFKVYLPRLDAAQPSPDRTPLEAPPDGSETILLVEDEGQIRDFAREALELFGYTILEASRPFDALRLAERHQGRIDLLLTDVVMPDMSGRDLADSIAPVQPGIKVLFMSGYTGDAIAHHGILRPGLAFLQKPFTPDALARKVRDVLDRGAAPTHPA